MIEGALPAERAVHFAATLLIEGCVVFQLLFAREAGGLAFGRFVFRAIVAAWVAAVVSGVAWWLLLAANIDGTSVNDALADGTAWTLLTETQFGWNWLARAAGFLLLLILLGAEIYTPLIPAKAGDGRRGNVLLGLAIALSGSLAWSGHGAATAGANGAIHLTADILHLIASGIWLGGLLPFTIILIVQRHLAAEITRRFSSLATACVLALIATGIVNVAMTLDGLDALTGTLYGQLLLAKLALFVVMLAFAGVNRFVLTPQLASSHSENARSRLVIHSGCEIALGLAILALVGVLGTLAPVDEHRHHATSEAYSPTLGSVAAGPRNGRSGMAIRKAMPQAATKAQAAKT